MSDLDTRLWAKVDMTETCWLWTGHRDTQGYGQIRAGGRGLPLLMVHRLAYELLVGPIPDGLVLDHLCRVRVCVNPAHLEPVTNAENLRRGLGPYGLRTKCANGHDITDPANVYVAPKNGHRRCRTCQRDTNRRIRERSMAR